MDKEQLLSWAVKNLPVWPNHRNAHICKAPGGAMWSTNEHQPYPILVHEDNVTLRISEWEAAKVACAVPFEPFVSVEDAVNRPKHYQLVPGVEVYDIRQALAAKATQAGATLDQFSDYDRAVEYLLRMWDKNGKQDAEKAAWYLNKLIGKL